MVNNKKILVGVAVAVGLFMFLKKKKQQPSRRMPVDTGDTVPSFIKPVKGLDPEGDDVLIWEGDFELIEGPSAPGGPRIFTPTRYTRNR